MKSDVRLRHAAFPEGVTREGLLDWFRDGRRRSRELFEMIVPDAYYERPIALRNPIVFYEGHLAAFAVNTLLRLALKRPGIDARLESLFARGIDPESEEAARPPTDLWPSRKEVLAYVHAADEHIGAALLEADIDDPSSPHMANGEAVFTVLEHEQMHQETLLYMFHNLPHASKRAPRPVEAPAARSRCSRERVRIPRGKASLGGDAGSFGWDNEFPRMEIDVEPFEIDADNVTNGEFLEFIEATGANPPHFWARSGSGWLWRGMFENRPLDPAAPVWVTQREASEYARWKGCRLPTEAEYHRAAFGTPAGVERLHPWGDDPAEATRGNFDFGSWDPLAVGSYPAGTSAWGVRDLVGNGWEWTSSVFDGFPGFRPMASYPQYSADFFDGGHYVMKGASPATARHLVRRSFRNWFRPAYPYVYATFRCV